MTASRENSGLSIVGHPLAEVSTAEMVDGRRIAGLQDLGIRAQSSIPMHVIQVQTRIPMPVIPTQARIAMLVIAAKASVDF